MEQDTEKSGVEQSRFKATGCVCVPVNMEKTDQLDAHVSFIHLKNYKGFQRIVKSYAGSVLLKS